MQSTHVPVAFLRSVGSMQNGFALESFIDALAHAGGKDPVELRRQLLKDHKDCVGGYGSQPPWDPKTLRRWMSQRRRSERGYATGRWVLPNPAILWCWKP